MKILFLTGAIWLFSTLITNIAAQPWKPSKASKWYALQPWLVGCNYAPANAINQLEMWQLETFDVAQIERELGWAETLGFNTLRVFLHDLLWQQDAIGLVKRMDIFLAICQKHHIRPMFVLFDSVWDPNPTLGKQREPRLGIHNSGWVQSPGAAALQDTKQYARLKDYVVGVVTAFAKDKRVLAWDIWNEPDNANTNNYVDLPNKLELVETLLPQVFDWARSAKPSQPLTSGVWKINSTDFKAFTAIETIQLKASDVISFHSYDDAARFEKTVLLLKQFNRPIICTEYLARGYQSTFETIMPIGKREKIALYNWGFVVGKTQTNLPWDSWAKPYVGGREPAVWHHEILHQDGKPYKQSEVEFIKSIIKLH